MRIGMLAVLLVSLLALPILGATTLNDSSCDIALQPAATLLVPYFEVAVNEDVSTAKTTLITITNVSHEPQIANVTLWTNLDRPVLNFPVFLTGYDVQALNLYELLVQGFIAPPNGTSSATTPGRRSLPNQGNPRFLPSAAQACSRGTIPFVLPAAIRQDVLNAFTTGRIAGCTEPVAVPQPGLATGYITIDLVATCTPENALSPAYWDVLLYDNVLTGDWEIVAPNRATGNYAEGNPMVHIRAVPEGGNAGSAVQTTLPFTFYDRLLPEGKRRTDRRQPLPSAFVARYIEGGATAFATELLIWREARTGASPACGDLAANQAVMAEIVRFDERENPTARWGTDGTFPVAGSVGTATTFFPPLVDDVGGWIYLNLNNGGSSAYSAASRYDLVTDSSTVRGLRQSQAWVTTRMAAEGRYAVAFDSTALGNGCTPAPASPTMASVGATLQPIGPAPERASDVLPVGNVTHRNDDSCDIALLPAATLLLPHFRVEANSLPSHATTTLITIINTSSQPQIARATIWTDWAYPVLTFDIFLTGYDVQAINLYDLIVNGRLPGSGSHVSPSGARSVAGNPRFLDSARSNCASLPSSIPAPLAESVRRALQIGLLPGSCGNTRIGGANGDDAAGYMTVDLVATCSAKSPRAPGAADELLFDNVLTGDYQIVDPTPRTGNFAYGAPLVHIRAIPEGGSAGEMAQVNLPRTFYERLYGESRRDRRQPLPSTFAARYIQAGSTSFLTAFAIWREAGTTQPGNGCFGQSDNGDMQPFEIVRFDERENPTTAASGNFFGLPDIEVMLPASSLVASSSAKFPPLESGDVGGWMYLNLALPVVGSNSPLPNQAWVVTTMAAEGRYGVAFDATALGNGCSAPRGESGELGIGIPIGPSN